MDVLWLIVVPLSGAITGGGIIGMVSIILRRYRRLKREREAFKQRLEEQVQRVWACMKCGASCGPERPRGGLCMYCQWDFQAYLQEVA